MNNKDIYLKNPATQKLVNEGVANVNDEQTQAAMDVLRYELETFVCDGQYEKGMEHILSTYLDNLNEAQQPAVWVSGFYGSGKSHLVKMLRDLWGRHDFSRRSHSPGNRRPATKHSRPSQGTSHPWSATWRSPCGLRHPRGRGKRFGTSRSASGYFSIRWLAGTIPCGPFCHVVAA